jgi:quinol monooxygenase YgiN
MVVQIVQFQLAGISPEEYEAHAEQIAPAFARLPGLIAKAWLGDPGENTYGGVYLWADRAAAEAYADGELLAAARQNPAFAGFRSSILDTLVAPTALTTQGLTGLSATGAPA